MCMIKEETNIQPIKVKSPHLRSICFRFFINRLICRIMYRFGMKKRNFCNFFLHFLKIKYLKCTLPSKKILIFCNENKHPWFWDKYSATAILWWENFLKNLILNTRYPLYLKRYFNHSISYYKGLGFIELIISSDHSLKIIVLPNKSTLLCRFRPGLQWTSITITIELLKKKPIVGSFLTQ